MPSQPCSSRQNCQSRNGDRALFAEVADYRPHATGQGLWPKAPGSGGLGFRAWGLGSAQGLRDQGLLPRARPPDPARPGLPASGLPGPRAPGPGLARSAPGLPGSWLAPRPRAQASRPGLQGPGLCPRRLAALPRSACPALLGPASAPAQPLPRVSPCPAPGPRARAEGLRAQGPRAQGRPCRA
ncbi:hypothetical protein OIU85_022994 [Salix viminalis]|uniref:Uncharacterized protein n=1 Tax=Salix viminalis TaxID=40686 RepID=A0A9Q0U7Z7_SALVM|nr:hypothetical protein OIU85_022994 [Salix viminalis]